MLRPGRETAERPVSKGPTRPADGGFTLLELLISMTLLVVILVITMGAMRMGSRSVAAGERKMEAQERFRAVLSIMDAQIASQLPLTYEGESGTRFTFRGDGQSLRFATGYSIWSGRRGYVVVEYVIEAAGGGKSVLYAQERIPGIEGLASTRLIEASEMSFDYFYKGPVDEKGGWVDAMVEGTAIPGKIRFRMALGKEKISMVFAVRTSAVMAPVQGGKSS
ncbi:MAG: prepilin-type N-terminal cleavage/methylation domain-containing protein [Syntrophales bacterium]|jgi:prepilin-type N-terminal cleavage/methylation domain-containing protein|nr:prepilin-type N-terminal cleavage/methylation domain-containing protein [Syntrophales bacterium]